MTESSVADSRRLLELSPAERERRDVDPSAVRDALVDVVERGGRAAKVFVDCEFPALELDYEALEGRTQHPLVFRNCSFGRIHAEHADVRVPIAFEGCTVDGLSLDGARFEYDVALRETTVTESVDATEVRFDRDADFSGSTFAATFEMDEGAFGDDTSFVGATFDAPASFRAAAFHGSSNALGDNADFTDARFEAEADFRQATFEATAFESASFAGPARFEEATFDDDAAFAGAAFRAEAIFDEAGFGADTSFADGVFAGPARFRGAVFEGGARTLHDDASFADVEFRAEADFRASGFRDGTFESATFAERATFEEAHFDGDADFPDVTFAGAADFDEAQFGGDAGFSRATFEGPAAFRGATFEGASRHLRKSAVFAETAFTDDVAFTDATFTSANFRRVRFGGTVDFVDAAFAGAVDFLAETAGSPTYVDFTGAVLTEGAITQPEGTWVRYDLTRASVGDVEIAAERPGGRDELLDYFRFCNTDFDEFDGSAFDFSAHTYYFDRNEWDLHTFDDFDADREYAQEMSPENVETTYLKAKKAASDGGYVKAAGEFRVQRQRHARRKFRAIASAPGADLRTRVSNTSRAAENAFLDVTCGYGMRLGRILTVFLLVPLGPALLYAFGGPLFLTGAGQLSSLGQVATPEGWAILYRNLHFSYITFLTIGYGSIGPKGALARLLAGLEVYLSVILGGLVLYALVKRSEL